MSLYIVWIPSDDLRTAGKNDALAPLVLCRKKNVVGSLNIVLQKQLIEIGLRIGRCSKMNNHINITTRLLASIKIGNIECNNLMLFRYDLGKRSRIHICQAERILFSS